MGNSELHFLKMSGMVPPGKHKEFEQTFKFVLNQLSPDCLQFSLSADIFVADLYHFFSLWRSSASLAGFCKSQEFQVLEGAFRTLGTPGQNNSGKLVDIKLFEQEANDNN